MKITLVTTTHIVPKKNSFHAGVSKRGRLFQYRSGSAKTSEREIIQEIGHQRRALKWRTTGDPVRVFCRLKKTRGDLVGLVETILDALQGGHELKGIGCIIKDDKQVVALEAEWDRDWDGCALPKGETARIVVETLCPV